MLLLVSLFVSTQDGYYMDKAKGYMCEAEYYTKKAEGYDREAEYYNKKAQGYLRETDYYSRNKKYDKANTLPSGQMKHRIRPGCK